MASAVPVGPASPSRASDTRFLQDASAASLLTAAAILGLFLATRPHLHYPDATAYAEQVMRGQIFHPHHLLYNWVGSLAVKARSNADPITTLQGVNALAGAAGCGLLTFVLALATKRILLPALLGLVLGVTYGWWSLAVIWEAHTLPVVFMLAVAGVLMVRRLPPVAHGLLTGLLHAGAIVFHQTMVLAVPAVLVALALRSGGRARRVAAYAVTGALLVGSLYGVAIGSGGAHGREDIPIADFVLRDARLAKPPVDSSRRFEVLGRGWRTAFAAARVRQCTNAGQVLASSTLSTGQLEQRALRLSAGAMVVGAVPFLLALVPTARRFPTATVLALGWAAVAVPFVAWWEPGNYEYYVGVTAILLLWSGLGWTTLIERPSSPMVRRGLTAAVALLWGAVAAGLLHHNWEMEMATAANSTPPHQACNEGPLPTRGGGGGGGGMHLPR